MGKNGTSIRLCVYSSEIVVQERTASTLCPADEGSVILCNTGAHKPVWTLCHTPAGQHLNLQPVIVPCCVCEVNCQWKMLQNFVVEWLTHLLFIWQVLGSILVL